MRSGPAFGFAIAAIILPCCAKRRNESTPDAQPAKPAAKELRAVFVEPEDQGRKIDQCLSRGQRCGRHAADYFCRLNGYERSKEFATMTGAFPTVGLADLAPSCEAETGACVAFELIVCEDPILPEPN